MKATNAVRLCALLASTALIASACASNKAQTSTPAPQGKPKIVYIPQSMGNAYFQPISDGFKSQADALGFDYQETGPSSSDANSQIPFIDSAIQNHVAAIAISPNDPNSEVPALKRAIAAGIKVISVNSPIGAGGANATINPVDFSKVGPYLADLTSGLINAKGKYAILSAAQTAVGQNQWIADLKSYTAAHKDSFGRMSLETIVYGNDDPDRSATVMQGLLTNNTDLAAVISPTAAGLPAAAKVLSQSPKKGKLALTGLALPNSMKPYVQDGTVTKFALWDPKPEGVLGAALLMAMIQNKITANDSHVYANASVTADGKSYTLDDKGVVNAGELITFDKSNIGNYDF